MLSDAASQVEFRKIPQFDSEIQIRRPKNFELHRKRETELPKIYIWLKCMVEAVLRFSGKGSNVGNLAEVWFRGFEK